MSQASTPSVQHARLIGFAVAGVVLVLDQLVKWAILRPLDLPRVEQITILPIFNLTFAQNFGVSLGLFTAGSEGGRWALVAMTAAIAVGVLVWLLRERHVGETTALGLVLGGALGNILDRSFRGYVVDYADLHFGEIRPFLIFNLADVAITLGVLIILARSFLSRDKRAHSLPHGIDAASPAPEN